MTLLHEQIKYIEDFEVAYERLFFHYLKNYKTCDAYMKRYGEAKALFQCSISRDEVEFVQFCSVVNEGLGS